MVPFDFYLVAKELAILIPVYSLPFRVLGKLDEGESSDSIFSGRGRGEFATLLLRIGKNSEFVPQ